MAAEKWTESEKEILRRRYPKEGASMKLMGLFGRSKGSIRSAANRMRITGPVWGETWTLEERGIIAEDGKAHLREDQAGEAARSRARQLAMSVKDGPQPFWSLKKEGWMVESILRIISENAGCFAVHIGVVSLTAGGQRALIPGMGVRLDQVRKKGK